MAQAVVMAWLVLLILGLRGRIVSHDPLCRRCRYSLTGLVSKRCPECGSVVAATGIVVGERRFVLLGEPPDLNRWYFAETCAPGESTELNYRFYLLFV